MYYQNFLNLINQFAFIILYFFSNFNILPLIYHFKIYIISLFHQVTIEDFLNKVRFIILSLCDF